MATNSQTSRVNPLKLNDVNDSVAGGVLTSGTGTAQTLGQLGKTVEFADANEIFYDSSVGTLYPGLYQYVKTLATSTASPARGLVAFWYGDPANYVVTPDATDGEIAGIYINALTKGYYGYIQIEGIASVQFDLTQSQETPAVKDLVVQKSTTNTADALAGSTTITAAIYMRILGKALDAPVANTISRVELISEFLDK